MLTASSAAGVAVAFGSPVGGVLFALEEMTSTFANRTMWKSFFCAMIATMVLQVRGGRVKKTRLNMLKLWEQRL